VREAKWGGKGAKSTKIPRIEDGFCPFSALLLDEISVALRFLLVIASLRVGKILLVGMD
jgi:hypothetical protein